MSVSCSPDKINTFKILCMPMYISWLDVHIYDIQAFVSPFPKAHDFVMQALYYLLVRWLLIVNILMAANWNLYYQVKKKAESLVLLPSFELSSI